MGTFVRAWNFDGAARLLATSDLTQILDPESDLGAAIALVLDGLSVTANLPSGGTTGQVLRKTTNNSGDVAWQDLGVSDITGLSSALTNKQDLIATGSASQVLAGDGSLKTLAQTDITGLVAALASKQAQDGDLDVIAALTKVNNSILNVKSGAFTLSTPATVKTDMALVKADVGLGNVDNTSDATKNSANAVLTNKAMSGTANTFSSIPTEAVTGLDAALAAIPPAGIQGVKWNGTVYPARSTSGTSDPNVVVMWIGGPGPTADLSNTGTAGSCDGDLWVRQV